MDIVTNVIDLHSKSLPINSYDNMKELNSTLREMLRLMMENNGCGIAAIQVGVKKNMFFALLEDEEEHKPYLELFINPVIIEKSTETNIDSEGCLSVPGFAGMVERATSIGIKYSNGRNIVVKGYSGMNARIIQHEYDHLQGVLYTDIAKEVMVVEEINNKGDN